MGRGHGVLVMVACWGGIGANPSYLRKGRVLPRKAQTIQAIDHAPNILLHLCTLPYYNALLRNTLDAVQEIENSEDPQQKRGLARRLFYSRSTREICASCCVLISSSLGSR